MSSEGSALLTNKTKQSHDTRQPPWIKYALVGGLVAVVGVGGVVWATNAPATTSPSEVVATNITTGANASTTPSTDQVTPAAYPAQYAEFYKAMFANMDASVDPCEDFYQYACGGWLEANELSDSESNIDTSFSIVNKNNDKIINDIMATKPDVIDPFYQACVREPAVNADAVADVTAQLRHIASLTSLDDLVAYAGALFANTTADSFFQVDVGADLMNSSANVLSFGQGGLTLPSIEYYANRATYLPVLQEYITGLSAHLDVLQGVDAAALFDFEAKFANFSLSNGQLRDMWGTYHKMDLGTVMTKFPLVASYLRGARPSVVNQTSLDALVFTPSFFTAQAALVSATDLGLVKAYVSFHLVHARSSLLGDTFRLINHKFLSVVNGLPVVESRQVFCMNLIKSYLGEYLGQLYMDKAFKPAAKAQARALIKQIEDAMVDLINHVDWLDDTTRRVALDKVAHVANFVGGPDSVAPLPFTLSASSFYDNMQRLTARTVESSFAKLGQPVDHTKWDMFAFTADAYNDPSANKMVFPAAFLQKPVYGASEFPAVANYARIGVVMGHELTHGFDDSGRNFDPYGQLSDWWTAGVKDTFVANAQCLVDQYSKFSVESLDKKAVLGYVDGRMTLGENIADNGGLKLSYMAYQKAKKADPSIADIGYDDAKLFFTAFVQGWWCKKATDNYNVNWLHTNPHSPTMWRAKGPMMNSQLFADAFQCPKGSPMNPTNKCVVW